VEEVASEPHVASVVESTVRVDVRLLDRMMDLVGELVLARNQLMQVMLPNEDSEHVMAYRRVDRVTNDLQAEVMKTRMQPIEAVFQMLPRLLRDLAGAFQKQARLDLEGGETELDRTMLEAVRDPLVHLLRNALDHGIEVPAERRRLGKPVEGRVVVRAYHQGGQVTVEVSDDGAGIDPSRLKRKAAEVGLVTSEAAAEMTDADALNFIFMRGFSTATEVTNYSGRGVGMDVVRVNVERVGGTVEVISEQGVGTTTRLRIPLTLAIIPALVVIEGRHRYAIPQVNVQELVRLQSEGDGRGIEDFNGVPVFRLRGRLLPVVFLGDELWGRPETFEIEDEAAASRQMLVLQADDRLFGLVVETIEGTQEIVVKPLTAPVAGIPILAGATILGDGTVALILDAVGLAQRAGVVTESRRRALLGRRRDQEVVATTGQQLLLMLTPSGAQAVLPLDQVVRLEQIPTASIEHLGGHEVVQHRGEILPLVRVVEGQWSEGAAPPAPPGSDEQALSVIVFAHQDRRFGLIVGDVVDIIDETPELQEVGRREGVLGSMIVRGHVAEAVDIDGLVRVAQRAAEERERLAQAGEDTDEAALAEPAEASEAVAAPVAAAEEPAPRKARQRKSRKSVARAEAPGGAEEG
jgi:two-component system, chemotaxis family, sensor kinase CheA